VVVAGVAGWACQTGIYEPLSRRGASMLVIVMASLGLTIVAENCLALAFGPSQKTLLVDMGMPMIVGGVVVSTAQIIAPVLAILIVGLTMYVMYRTDLGRRVQALIVDEELLRLQGIAAQPVRRACVALGSALLPVPALLLMLSGTGVSPFIGLPPVLIGAMALFLGGLNSLLGAAIGGFLIGFVENVALIAIPSSWQAAFTYSLFLALILIRPTGLFGRRLIQTSV
jgi:branched-chain amino acid transport system permease protein